MPTGCCCRTTPNKRGIPGCSPSCCITLASWVASFLRLLKPLSVVELAAPLYSLTTTSISRYFARKHVPKVPLPMGFDPITRLKFDELISFSVLLLDWAMFWATPAVCVVGLKRLLVRLSSAFRLRAAETSRFPLEKSLSLASWPSALFCLLAFCGFCSCLPSFPATPAFFLFFWRFFWSFLKFLYLRSALILAGVTFYLSLSHSLKLMSWFWTRSKWQLRAKLWNSSGIFTAPQFLLCTNSHNKGHCKMSLCDCSECGALFD